MLKLTLMGLLGDIFATCGGIFCGSIGEFIDVLYVFLEVQTAMIAEFYGVIYAIEEAQKMGLTNV